MDPEEQPNPAGLVEGHNTHLTQWPMFTTPPPHGSPGAQPDPVSNDSTFPTACNLGDAFLTPSRATLTDNMINVSNYGQEQQRYTSTASLGRTGNMPSDSMSPYGHPYDYQHILPRNSALTAQSGSNKRKHEDEHQKRGPSRFVPPAFNTMPPRALAQPSASPMLGTMGSHRYYQLSNPPVHMNGPSRNASASVQETSRFLDSYRAISQSTSPIDQRLQYSSMSLSVSQDTQDTNSIFATANGNEGRRGYPCDFACPVLPQFKDMAGRLDFDVDCYWTDKSALHFMTVGDRLRAKRRGYMSADQVYRERLRRPNIETMDINLAWIPELTWKHDSMLPWEPIFGPAAYIASVRGEIELKFEPGERVYIKGETIGSGKAIDIPMLQDFDEVRRNVKEFCRVTYAHGRTKILDKEDQTFFMPSQAEWGPSSLPPSAAVLEPFRHSRSEVPTIVDRNGNVVHDSRGNPRRAFDHILPACISSTVDGWAVAAWLSEDPRIHYKDIEAHMGTGEEIGRLPDRYAKYRDSVSALTRGATTAKKSTTKNEMKAVKENSEEQLIGNSWWHVDLTKGLMCQTKEPWEAIVEQQVAAVRLRSVLLQKNAPIDAIKRARVEVKQAASVFSLPMRRKRNGEYSHRVREAKLEVERKEHVQEEEEMFEALTGQGQFAEQ